MESNLYATWRKNTGDTIQVSKKIMWKIELKKSWMANLKLWIALMLHLKIIGTWH